METNSSSRSRAEATTGWTNLWPPAQERLKRCANRLSEGIFHGIV
jgi:hypothetical protein